MVSLAVLVHVLVLVDSLARKGTWGHVFFRLSATVHTVIFELLMID